MHSEQISKLLNNYQLLSVEQQMIVKLLAVYHDYMSLTSLSKCLYSLGIKDGSKMVKTESIKTRIKELIKEGVLQENTKPGGTRCARSIAELIVRQMVDAGEFERYAELVIKESGYGNGYYRYHSVEECVREVRIHFYRGDYALVQTGLKLGERYPGKVPDQIELYLNWFLNPLDLDWFSRHHPSLLVEMAGIAGLHQQLYLYQHADLSDFLVRMLETPEGSESDLLTRVVLELKFLRGEWAELPQMLTGAEEPDLQAILAALSFFQGNYAQAISQYEAALGGLRKLTGQRNIYFYGLAGVFYPLAVLKHTDVKYRNKLPVLLNQAIKANGYWTGVYHYLSLYQQFLQGDLSKRQQLLGNNPAFRIHSGFKESGSPDTIHAVPLLQQVFLLLIQSWVNSAPAAKVPPQDQQLYSYLANNGYRWPAAELAKMFCGLEPGRAKQWPYDFFADRPLALANLFVSRPDWELALDALANLTITDKKPESAGPSGKATRFVWLLSLDETNHSFDISPREQKQQAKGGWSAGRAIALKRLAQETAGFDFLSEQDLKLCAHIKECRDSGWYGRGTFFEFDNTTPEALIGHPSLFLQDAPEVRVEVVKGNVELHVKKLDKGDKIKIVLEPQPFHEQKYHIVKETPTRWRVVEFNADHHRVYGVLGAKGLEVPLSAKDRVLQSLTGISGLLTVHSDIGGSSSSAEQIEADPTPRIHLLPLGEGLRVAMLIRPFASGGSYFQPGQGSVSVLAEIDGKPLQAKRDLKQEKRNAAQVLAACPTLQQAERDAGGDWLLDSAEPCLELLLEIQALPPEQAILEWPEGVRFRLLGQSSGSGFSMQIKRDSDWFALQGELSINNDTVLEIQQLLGLLDNRQGRFLQLKDGQFLALTDEFRRRLEELKAYVDVSGKKVRINPLAALSLENWQEQADIKADKHWQAHLQRLQAARDYQPQLPSTFQAELRDYQVDGYNWLARLAHWGVGACLADDMGLGKTVQGLALLVERAPKGPSLIVAPTSVCLNWESEARRFAPTLQPMVLGAGDRQRLMDNLRPFDLLICSYGLLQQEQVAEMLAKLSFSTVILDEAQAIKNVATRRSQGAMSLQADFKMIMTGTPLENHLGELWNLFRFINPGLLGSLEQYNKRFAGPIERDRNPEARQQLKKLIQPFILRRTKTQVLQELPPRTEIPIYVELSPEELAFYEAIRRESLAILSGVDAPPGHKHLQILAAITKLRRSCCNSRLVNADIALPSSKLAAFGEIVDELLENKHKALVFSQFVDHLHIIQEYVEQRGISYQYLDGSTPAKDRQQRVEAFQRGEGELFLISLKAGGVGLNLTAADYVIHMDPWWNPAVEDQASDRAHRMGQLRPVTIYRMIAKQTIEEKIVALHGHKRDLADSLLDGADISGKVSTDDLLSLMRGDA